MPRLYRVVLGIPHDDPRPMTLTGGLPYFGGPGSNYVTHSIAEAVNRCRCRPHEVGLITANGWYCTKHSVGLYGARPPETPWERTAPERFQEALALPPSVDIDRRPAGRFTVDSYTVWFSRQGEPEVGILVGRTHAGTRAWAQTPKGDRDVLEAMMSEEWVGRHGTITRREGDINLVDF